MGIFVYEGVLEGILEGVAEGDSVGETVGVVDGEAVGVPVGLAVGDTEGIIVGAVVGVPLGPGVCPVSPMSPMEVGSAEDGGRDGAGVANREGAGDVVGVSSLLPFIPFGDFVDASPCARRRPSVWRRSFTLGRSG